MFGRSASEMAAALPAGCKSAVFASGVVSGFGAACFAGRARAAGFELSPESLLVRRAMAFVGRFAGCAVADCADFDEAARDHAI
jgi:hypothetical protein